MIVRVTLLLFCLLLAAPAWAAQVFEGKVVGISDGDTITVLTDEKRQVKVRLYGVDCPESKQAYGTRARQSTSNHVFGKRVRVEVADTDRYGRTVGIVTDPDGAVLNRELLAEGMAWLYTAYCRAPVCVEWKREEVAARQKKAGLWADASPTPPWEYRKAGRSGGRVKSAQSAPSSRNDDAIAGGYSGNTNSGIFHSSGCRYFDCKNCTAHFSSRDEAISAGYRPCKVCRP
ncbi:thermonuclease family protein [Desulfovibrio piger]|nr:thermonuclease family protein [Desulfovibrio piger]